MLSGFTLLLLAAGCGGEETTPESSETVRSTPAYVTASDPGEFLVSEIPASTADQSWMGSGPAEILRISVEVGDSLAAGDTVFTFREEVSDVEKQRLEMELAMASAMLSSQRDDTTLALRVDSLTALLDSLSESGNTAFLSSLDGVVTEVPVDSGQLVNPGSPVLQVSRTDVSLYRVRPPDGCTVVSWPSGHTGVRFVEEMDGYGVYSGQRDSLELLFGRTVALQRAALYERGLDSYLLTQSSDTVYVERLGQTREGLVVVLPEREVISRVRTWTDG
mgnify:CR=1 FL=1